MIIKGNDLYMTRGDTEYFTVNVFKDGEIYLLNTGDVIKFTVRTRHDSDIAVIEKTSDDFTSSEVRFELKPEDTNTLSRGKYVYDIELTKASGEVTTIIPPPDELANLFIGGDVSRE